MKKFFAEFKTFITRGNVLDMAVGIIVGSAFTAIVTALSNNILKPLINWLLMLAFGANSLSGSYTFLHIVWDEIGTINLSESIYIDWGALINAILNFLLVAFVLFVIVKSINQIKESSYRLTKSLSKNRLTREDRKELKARGIAITDLEALKAYRAEKAEKAKAAAAAAAAEKAQKEAEERLKNPTTEDLLKSILTELQEQRKS